MNPSYFSYSRPSVFITGGTGTLGVALIKRTLDLGYKVVVYSRDEAKQAALKQAFPTSCEIETIIGDVRDFEKLKSSIAIYNPDVIIHAAALKRIDDLELNTDECVKTNIIGSENVAKACIANGVKQCVLISTDKACSPTNTYGSSKLIAEKTFSNYNMHSDSSLFSVRYGNVACSRGSFIPLWRDLIKSSKKINVTSLEMTRFLFTVEDAVDCVIKAVNNAKGGEVFIPRISSFSIKTIVDAMSEIYNTKIDYEITGLRHGEKIHEDMISETELQLTFNCEGLDDMLYIIPRYWLLQKNKETPCDVLVSNKYNGPPINSKDCQGDTESAIKIIKKGLGLEE